MNLFELHKIAVKINDLEELYDEFDAGHDRRHENEVAALAKKLAIKKGLKDLEVVDLAARLHDIGRIEGKERHAVTSARMIREDERFEELGERRRKILIDAVRNHMHHTGEHTGMVAKIVSDADDAAGWRSPAAAIHRSYHWGLKNHPEWTKRENLLNAVDYLAKEYAPDGPAMKTYFQETKDYINKSYPMIKKLSESHDYEKIKELLDSEM